MLHKLFWNNFALRLKWYITRTVLTHHHELSLMRFVGRRWRESTIRHVLIPDAIYDNLSIVLCVVFCTLIKAAHFASEHLVSDRWSFVITMGHTTLPCLPYSDQIVRRDQVDWVFCSLKIHYPRGRLVLNAKTSVADVLHIRPSARLYIRKLAFYVIGLTRCLISPHIGCSIKGPVAAELVHARGDIIVQAQ